IDVLDRAGPLWRYALEPVTGRKHQLRVHMAALGAPIEGDRYYPSLCPQAPDDFTRPLQLLASGLAFADPLAGQPRSFETRRALQLRPLSAYFAPLGVLDQVAGHAFRQVDRAVLVAELDAADVAAFEVSLVGDGADDVARLYAVAMADFDPEGLHPDVVRTAR